MRDIQKDILDFSKKEDISKFGLREICRLLDIKNPQTVKYFLEKLERDKKISYFGKRNLLTQKSIFNFIKVPILGSANCGEANIFAEERNEGFLNFSPGMLKKTKNVFALRACGESMVGADIGINDGDFVIVDSEYNSPKKGDYVVSIINNCANIKKFNYDNDGNVVLLSEPKKSDIGLFPPIYIHKNDLSEYRINGKVIQVFKNPQD